MTHTYFGNMNIKICQSYILLSQAQISAKFSYFEVHGLLNQMGEMNRLADQVLCSEMDWISPTCLHH